MNAKEKAKELVEKYCDIGSIDLDDAKQCALIAVDEIIDSHYSKQASGHKTYWLNVKKEIELL